MYITECFQQMNPFTLDKYYFGEKQQIFKLNKVEFLIYVYFYNKDDNKFGTNIIKINLLVHCREQTFKTKTRKEISESSQQNKSGSGG